MNRNYRFLRDFCIVMIFAFCVSGCNSEKYLQEIPYKFKYDIADIKNNYGVIKNPSLSRSNEYASKLTDHEIYLKEKYAIVLKVEPSEIINYKLYSVVDDWLDKKHKYSGVDDEGISMGNLTQLVYQEAYDSKLPPSPLQIFNSPNLELFLGRKFMKEGDIIFFRYNKDNPVSDVGIYLKNDLILSSTPSNGVAIFDFNSTYFQLRYLCAGRVKPKEE